MLDGMLVHEVQWAAQHEAISKYLRHTLPASPPEPCHTGQRGVSVERIFLVICIHISFTIQIARQKK